MASEWAPTTIGEHFDLVSGYAFKSQEFLPAGIRVIKIKNVKAGYFSEDVFSYVDPKYLELRADKIAKQGDLLISMSGNRHDGSPSTWVGKVAYFNKTGQFLINQRVGALRLKNDSDFCPRFMAYLLSSWQFQNLYISIATSSGGQANISPKQILGTPFEAPSPVEQRAIAHVLGSLDEKIELNSRMNETMEKMARAVFKSWFIDFNPVRAKATGRDTGLPNGIADLFPDTLEDSEFGEHPTGWTRKEVSTLIDINPRLALSKGQVARHVDMKALPKSGFSVSTVIDKEFKGGAKFQQHDVLLARITPCLENGKTALVDFLGDDQVGFGSTEFIVLRGRNGITREYVYCLARDDQFRQHCISSMVGSSGRQRVQNACFDHFFLAEAPESVLTAFTDCVGPSFEKITENSRESAILSKLRDTLLPNLVSGELPIHDAEMLLESTN